MPNIIHTTFSRKPSTLAEARQEIQFIEDRFGSNINLTYVAAEKHLSSKEWLEFTNSFLIDRDWIGAFSDQQHPVIDHATPCIRITGEGSQIALLIDPQGYRYARYVGIEFAELPNREEDKSMYEDYETEDFKIEEAEGLTESEVVDGLRALLMGESLEDTLLDSCTHTRTYEEGGYMTNNQGFTIHMADGSVFQITVKQER